MIRAVLRLASDVVRTLALACLVSAVTFAAEKSFRLTVHAGEFARVDAIVAFALPDDTAHWRLRDPEGRIVACQIGPGAMARFILPRLDARQSATYTLEKGPGEAQRDRVAVRRRGGVLRVTLDEQPVLDFQIERAQPPAGLSAAYGRAGYIHPIFSPSGLVVTDDMAPDNPQQHGIWCAWPNTEFEGRAPNFWDAIPTSNPAQHRGAGSGRVELAELNEAWSGPVHAGFHAELRYVDQSAQPEKIAILETWTVRVYAVGLGAERHHVFDLESVQRCAGESAVRFPEHRYGGFCVRGRREWLGPAGVSFLTSAGETDRLKANASRARWCHMGGALAGQLAGVAVLAHPQNFRFPEPLRVHPELPFFNFAPSQAGPWELAPREPRAWRYRFVVRDGRADREDIERFWNDYATPVRVVVEPAAP